MQPGVADHVALGLEGAFALAAAERPQALVHLHQIKIFSRKNEQFELETPESNKNIY